ncbi:MAG: glutamyl-tRNA reductase [Desulfomonilia bacterium]
MNRISCITINHKNAPVDVLEKIRIQPQDMLAIMGEESEVYTLNTCNRTEVYWTAIETSVVMEFLGKISGMERNTLEDVTDVFTGKNAIRHLFTVASGLDSLVIGEPQILGQVKDAYRQALRASSTSILLNKALHRTFRAAKRIRSETDIGAYPVSVASEAVELAEHIFGDISTSSVLVIGAGDMAGTAAKRLQSRGVKRLCIVNRTHRTACDLAAELGGIPKPFESMEEELVASDIIITSTGSPRPIIGRELMERVMRQRKNNPIIIIDIAVPRDVDPSVSRCYNCYLYDIDALKSIVDRHFTNREHEATRALEIIEEEVEKFDQWILALDATSTIRDIFSLAEQVVDDEISKMTLNGEQKKSLEESLRLTIRRLLHRPVSFLKAHPDIEYIEYARRIFQLDEDYQDRHKG